MCSVWRKRAVVIDDNDFVREYLSDFLEDKGYEVDAFDSPPDPRPPFCNEACRHNGGLPCCDVLVVDYEMPGKSGFEFLMELREKDCKIFKIAIVPGSWTSDRLEKVIKSGYRTFNKPLPVLDFEEWLG